MMHPIRILIAASMFGAMLRPIKTLPEPGEARRNNNPPGGKTYRPNGTREVARRLKQMARRSA
jgi:hypothetical protein